MHLSRTAGKAHDAAIVGNQSQGVLLAADHLHCPEVLAPLASVGWGDFSGAPPVAMALRS
jgi:hypothetical protein